MELTRKIVELQSKTVTHLSDIAKSADSTSFALDGLTKQLQKSLNLKNVEKPKYERPKLTVDELLKVNDKKTNETARWWKERGEMARANSTMIEKANYEWDEFEDVRRMARMDIDMGKEPNENDHQIQHERMDDDLEDGEVRIIMGDMPTSNKPSNTKYYY